MFESVLVISAGAMFTAHQVFNGYVPLRPADPRHLAQHAQRFFDMMEREAAHGHIKFPIRERQPLGIAALKTDIRQAALLPLPFSDGQQRVCEIEPDRFTATLTKSQRQVPGTASDLEHARFWR